MSDIIAVDSTSFAVHLAKAKLVLSEGMKLSLLDIGHEILRLSQREVPHDKGTLQNSGNVQEISGDVIIGYHTPYAHRLHEHPEYHFKNGRKGKYLTDPIARNAHLFGIDLTADMKARLEVLGKV